MSRPIWRANDRLVVQCDEQFWVIDATGQIVERHVKEQINGGGMITYIEYRVRGAELLRETCIATFTGEDFEDEIVLAGLQVVDDPDARQFVETVLDDELVAAEERRLRESK